MTRPKGAKRRKLRDDVLARSAGCIYCAGSSPASTIDHMPPMAMFSLRHRPKGLEFPSCEACNTGAKRADLVAAYVGRIYPDPATAEEEAELVRLVAALMNNLPGLIPELQVGRASARRNFARLGLDPNEGGFLRLSGPLALSHLESFGARLGFAMHFHETGAAIPMSGAVAVRVFSNVEIMEGRIPDQVFAALPSSSTLRAGRFDVGDQFRYSARSDGGARVLSFASFRRAFAVLAVSTTDAALLPGELRRFVPGQLRLSPPVNYWSRVRLSPTPLSWTPRW